MQVQLHPSGDAKLSETAMKRGSNTVMRKRQPPHLILDITYSSHLTMVSSLALITFSCCSKIRHVASSTLTLVV